MPQILHTTLIRDRAVDAAGETFQVDLPVNPLSAIIVTMRALKNGALTVAADALDAFAAKYTDWRVTYRGATIINGSTADLMVAMGLRERQQPHLTITTHADDAERWLTFPLLFGRRMYDALSCFPATRRGDLILQITAAADAGALDGHSLQAETVELLDAKPTSFVKVTTIAQAMAAIGRSTIDLPIGNRLIGALLRPFTAPTAGNYNSSFGTIALEVDNVEVMESRRNWESCHGMLARRLPVDWSHREHVHGFVDAAAGQVDTQEQQSITALDDFYAYLDWDPLDDGAYILDTKGAANVRLAMESDVADGASTSRVLPIELVQLAAAA